MKLLREYVEAILSERATDPGLKKRFDAFMKEYESMTERNPIGFRGDRYWYMGEIEGKYCLVVTNINILTLLALSNSDTGDL